MAGGTVARGAVDVAARPTLTPASKRFEGSFARDLIATLKSMDFGSRILLFGANMLLSVLPMIIVLSAFASHRIDDDLSRHLGLSAQGSRVVAGLFRSSTVRFNVAILLGLLLSLVGTLGVATSLQRTYEELFDAPHRSSWRNVARCGAWVVVAGGLLIAEGALGRSLRHGVLAAAVLVVVELAGLALFFLWTLHFLLAGRASWRALAPAAVATAGFCIGLGAFASLYLSSTIVSDSRLYGAIGAVFDLLTWFIAIGAVLNLCPAVGKVWSVRQHRRDAASS